MLPQHVLNLENFAIGMLDLIMLHNMPYKQIVSRGLQAGASLSMSTVSNVVTGKRLPTEAALEGILLGLGPSTSRPIGCATFRTRLLRAHRGAAADG